MPYKKYVALSFIFVTALAVADTVETIFTLSDDMRSATSYFSKRRNNSGNNTFIFDKNFDKSLITYARPDNYAWKTERDGNQNVPALYFPNTSSYAYLQRSPNSSKFLRKDKENPNRYFMDVDGSACVGNPCSQEESIISVIIPSRFKVLNYGAKVDDVWTPKEQGQWRVVDNTYTFYRKNLRGAVAQFYLEDAASYGYNKLSQSFEKNKEIDVTNEGNRIRVVMPIERLFDSGSAQMQKSGLEWIKTLSDAVSDFSFFELRVEGHTDNVPIAKKTQQGHSNNWELSSARASNIVQFLILRGVAPQKLAAVGYADSRPIAPNDSEKDKAKNRRIEFSILISESTESNDQTKLGAASKTTVTVNEGSAQPGMTAVSNKVEVASSDEASLPEWAKGQKKGEKCSTKLPCGPALECVSGICSPNW